MQYLISFLEGIITFISPCLLPMLPLYISYFAGSAGKDKDRGKHRALVNALGFVLGFTAVFMLMGAFAGSFGMFLMKYKTVINVIFGIILIVFGLNFMGALQIGFINQTRRASFLQKEADFLGSILFGIIFSVGWTPCVGTFLGSALMLASSSASFVTGMFMLLSYSLGLGIPFLISAVLIEELKNTFRWIKSHYDIITKVSGGLLIVLGAAMMFGWLDKLLAVFTV